MTNPTGYNGESKGRLGVQFDDPISHALAQMKTEPCKPVFDMGKTCFTCPFPDCMWSDSNKKTLAKIAKFQRRR